MLLGGDEFMRTQKGNNNAYCQDNEISWFNWEDAKKNDDILEFFKKTIVLTKRYTILQRRKFFLGKDLNANNIPDLSWFGADGKEPIWTNPSLHTLCYQLDGSEERSELGEYHLFVILNSDHNTQYIKLPELRGKMRWHRVIDTSLKSGEDILEGGKEMLINPPEYYIANLESVAVLLSRLV